MRWCLNCFIPIRIETASNRNTVASNWIPRNGQSTIKIVYMNDPLHDEISMKLPSDTPDPKFQGLIVKLNTSI